MTNLNEYMSCEELIILNENEKIDTYLSISSSKKKCCLCYVVDDKNRYVGKISEWEVLDFISSSLIMMKENSSEPVMDRVRELRMKELIEANSETLTIESDFSEMLVKLNRSSHDAMAVLDMKGRILGEISVHNVIKKLECPNAFNRMPVKVAG